MNDYFLSQELEPMLGGGKVVKQVNWEGRGSRRSTLPSCSSPGASVSRRRSRAKLMRMMRMKLMMMM